MANYLTYPCKTMRISQTHSGTTSHSNHTIDRPWDEGCTDSGRDWMYCPCNEMMVKKISGLGDGYTNTIFLESTSLVLFADNSIDYLSMQVTHSEDEDLRNIRVGQLFRRGEKICREGKNGATGNHFHFSAKKGTFLSSNCWRKVGSAWCIDTTNSSTPTAPDLFFVDPNFTKISNSKGYKFKKLPDGAVVDNTDTLITNIHPFWIRNPEFESVDPEAIWKLLIMNFEKPEMVAGIMGNIFYESAFLPTNLENTKNTKLDLSDIEYTNKVDSGAYTLEQFKNDKAGYGLVQWTSSDRKEGLYNYCKSVGGSIGSILTQVEYLCKELQSSYVKVFNSISKAETVKQVSNIFLDKFESPKDKGVSVQNKRNSKSQEYFDKYKNITAEMARQEFLAGVSDAQIEDLGVDLGLIIDFIIISQDFDEEEKN